MKWVLDLVTNPFLITVFSAFGLAQIIKTIIYGIKHRTFRLDRLLMGDGGMPSGHSATVSSLAMLCGLVKGLNSWEFAISTVLVFVVCKDAMGVRREVGHQAEALNQMHDSGIIFFHRRYNVLAGHKPIEVIAGALLGILDAAVVYLIFY